MPPRYAYWTILIDQQPTAFRSREREELLPTLHQLQRKNADVTLRWFARGQLWESPAQAQAALRAPAPPREPRSRDWRPGGEHRDPRDRFKKRAQQTAHRPHGPRDKPKGGAARPPGKPFAPRRDDNRDRKVFAPRGPGDRARKPFARPDRNDRHAKSFAPRGQNERDHKSFSPRGPAGPRKPWHRDPPDRQPPGDVSGKKKPDMPSPPGANIERRPDRRKR